jgi:hypothetical protein
VIKIELKGELKIQRPSFEAEAEIKMTDCTNPGPSTHKQLVCGVSNAWEYLDSLVDPNAPVAFSTLVLKKVLKRILTAKIRNTGIVIRENSMALKMSKTIKEKVEAKRELVEFAIDRAKESLLSNPQFRQLLQHSLATAALMVANAHIDNFAPYFNHGQDHCSNK